MGFKITIRPTDTLFSNYIRSRDNWTCQRCGRQYEPNCGASLQNSHFWGRGRENTRFEPDNCIALCFGCHRLWGHGDLRHEYEAYMKRILGEARFKTLAIQAQTYKARDDKMDMIIIKAMIKQNGG